MIFLFLQIYCLNERTGRTNRRTGGLIGGQGGLIGGQGGHIHINISY